MPRIVLFCEGLASKTSTISPKRSFFLVQIKMVWFAGTGVLTAPHRLCWQVKQIGLLN